MTFKELLWNRQTREYLRWLLFAGVCLTLAFGGVSLANSVSAGGGPAQLSEWQFQSLCAQSSGIHFTDACEIDRFEVKDNETTIHYRSPQPKSGDWQSLCPTFRDIPSNVIVMSLDLSTMTMQAVDNTSSFVSCEANFTLDR